MAIFGYLFYACTIFNGQHKSMYIIISVISIKNRYYDHSIAHPRDFLFLLDLFISFKINMYHHIFVRYVAAELATDIVINVGNVKFHLHKVRFNLTLR